MQERCMQGGPLSTALHTHVRAKLIADPKVVIEAQLQFTFTDNFEISVHENTANTLHILMPDIAEELSEIELSAVSGCLCWNNYETGCAT